MIDENCTYTSRDCAVIKTKETFRIYRVRVLTQVALHSPLSLDSDLME